jgi:tetratricopeptide (TPR) repeat protein
MLVRQGRDLMNRGEMLAAKERFDAAFRSNGDAEALFLSAECWERLGNGDEAAARYRQYLRLPLALRATEATMRIHALDERKWENARPGHGKPARYVLVPIAADRGVCAEKCTAAEVCPRPAHKGVFDECLGNQFSCLQSCDGATVGLGACPKLSGEQHLRCFQDRRRTVGPGWLTPGRF